MQLAELLFGSSLLMLLFCASVILVESKGSLERVDLDLCVMLEFGLGVYLLSAYLVHIPDS